LMSTNKGIVQTLEIRPCRWNLKQQISYKVSIG
jgi:hypothetical protein